MGETIIRWTDKTWNPVVGCNRVSPGCAHCYAKALHDKRHKAYLAGSAVPEQYAVPFEQVQLMPERLEYPLHWRQPARIFVNSVSDLFHEDVPIDFLANVFDVMACATLRCNHRKWADHTAECWTGQPHIFQVLTKRPEHMRQVIKEELPEFIFNHWPGDSPLALAMDTGGWPLPNVWLGTSVENQHWADIRVPQLLQTPAAVRFLSCEPLLGPLDLERWIGEMDCGACRVRFGGDTCPSCGRQDGDGEGIVGFAENAATPYPQLHWVIVGGESGSKRRPMDIEWARSLRDQCQAADVAYFFKQMGGARSETGQELDGVRWEQFPEVAA